MTPLRPDEPDLLDKRYEIKMVCEERADAAVMSKLRLHPAGIRELFPDRWVQSIYFDTHEGRSVSENLAGVSDREKIRLRWYGLGATGVRGQLERKRREATLGSKDTLELEQPIDVEGHGRHAFMRDLLRQLPPEWREDLAGLEPAQWIRYHRKYLTTADHAIRITVDRELSACDLRFGGVLSFRRATPLPRLLVVECKTSTEHRRRLEELIQSMPLIADKCSKFVLASAPEHGPIISRLGW